MLSTADLQSYPEISREFVKVEKGIGMKIRPNAERKKIKFNTYFEIYETDQGSKSFAISFDSYAKYMMFSDDSVKDRLLTKGIFQNIGNVISHFRSTHPINSQTKKPNCLKIEN